MIKHVRTDNNINPPEQRLNRIKSSAPSHYRTAGNNGSHLQNTAPVQGGPETNSHGFRRCHWGWPQIKGLWLQLGSALESGQEEEAREAVMDATTKDTEFHNKVSWVPILAKGPHASPQSPSPHPNCYPSTVTSSAVQTHLFSVISLLNCHNLLTQLEKQPSWNRGWRRENYCGRGDMQDAGRRETWGIS